jgi:hypothetical protein
MIRTVGQSEDYNGSESQQTAASHSECDGAMMINKILSTVNLRQLFYFMCVIKVKTDIYSHYDSYDIFLRDHWTAPKRARCVPL